MPHPPVLPSALRYDVGTLVAIISQLNALPAYVPVNALMAALRVATQLGVRTVRYSFSV
jgi:hypothetical protein